MRKKFVVFLVFCLVIVFILVLTESAYAHHKKRVLGDSTSASQLVFPPVTSGAGFILPDSPLFFLDQFSQTVKLLFAFSSEQRAKVRSQIAGERLAELRIMLERQNPEGINVALSQLTKEVGFVAKDLSDAAAQGADVKLLAEQINEDIKFQRKLLNLLADQTSGVLKRQLKTARQSLKEAKVEVEDELPEDELEKEIEDELEDEIEDEVEEASESAKKAEHLVDKLNEEASRSAEKALRIREKELRQASEKQNKEEQKAKEKLLRIEERKQKELFKARAKAADAVIKASKETGNASEELKRAQDKVDEIRQTAVGESSSGSGGSGSSGSGSSGSGDSDRSGSGGSDDD